MQPLELNTGHLLGKEIKLTTISQACITWLIVYNIINFIFLIMAIKINRSSAIASSHVVQMPANTAIYRNRFSKHSVQTNGDVYVSNKDFPSPAVPGADWAKVDGPTFGNMYVLNAPVNYIAVTADASVCSFVNGDL